MSPDSSAPPPARQRGGARLACTLIGSTTALQNRHTSHPHMIDPDYITLEFGSLFFVYEVVVWTKSHSPALYENWIWQVKTPLWNPNSPCSVWSVVMVDYSLSWPITPATLIRLLCTKSCASTHKHNWCITLWVCLWTHGKNALPLQAPSVLL